MTIKMVPLGSNDWKMIHDRAMEEAAKAPVLFGVSPEQYQKISEIFHKQVEKALISRLEPSSD
jgi:hypothetical protein